MKLPTSQASTKDALKLIRLHLELECIGLNARGRLVRIPGPDPDDVPRLYISQHGSTYTTYFGSGLSDGVMDELSGFTSEEIFHDNDAIRACLGKQAPCKDGHIGTSYVFPNRLPASKRAVKLTPSHSSIIDEFERGWDVKAKTAYAIVEGGRIVSMCRSSRENDKAGEAWVFTALGHRSRGYGSEVTRAWARDLLKQGKTPFYSHKLSNEASRGVALSLGLVQYIADVAYF